MKEIEIVVFLRVNRRIKNLWGIKVKNNGGKDGKI